MSMGTEKLSGQSLNEFLVEAANNNLSLQADYKSFEIALEEVQIASALPDPNLSFGYFISPIETRVGAQQARVSLKQMVPWFGTLKAKKDVVLTMAKSKYERITVAKLKIDYKMKTAYYNLYLIKEEDLLLISYLESKTLIITPS